MDKWTTLQKSLERCKEVRWACSWIAFRGCPSYVPVSLLQFSRHHGIYHSLQNCKNDTQNCCKKFTVGFHHGGRNIVVTCCEFRFQFPYMLSNNFLANGTGAVEIANVASCKLNVQFAPWKSYTVTKKLANALGTFVSILPEGSRSDMSGLIVFWAWAGVLPKVSTII